MAQNVHSVVSAYIRHLEQQRGSKARLDNVRRDLVSFTKFVGDIDVGDCRQIDLVNWLAAHPAWKSTWTRRNAVSSVVACFHWAEECELIERCHYRRPRTLRYDTPSPRRPAKAEEFLAIIRQSKIHLRRPLWFLWWTGARTCEMRSLRWSDVELSGTPVIRLTEHKTARKSGVPRLIALDKVTAGLLRVMRRGRPADSLVFTTRKGKPWPQRAFARRVKLAAVRGGVADGVTAYCLRHSFACAALEAGLTSKQVADHLGHSDTTMVERIYGSHTSRNLGYLSDNIRRMQRDRK